MFVECDGTLMALICMICADLYESIGLFFVLFHTRANAIHLFGLDSMLRNNCQRIGYL